MSPLSALRDALATAVVERQGLSNEWHDKLVRLMRRPEAGMGDLALPCFAVAGPLKKKAPELAAELAQQLANDDAWEGVEAVGPYLNVRFATAGLAKAVVPAAREVDYGDSKAGDGKTVVIDYSSPNIAKPLAFHHIRSTVIGQSVANLHTACGWNVVGINYLGDWGKQFGLLATGFARHGDPAKRADAKHLVEVYVKSNQDAGVAKLKATIAGPEKARAEVEELKKNRAAVETAEGKDLKKAKKRVASLEKRLLAARGLKDGDPVEGIESYFAELEAQADKAKADLPQAEAYDKEAREFLRKMESGDEEALAQWTEFRETSIAEFSRVYERMGIEFTSLEGESRYQDKLEATVERVREKPGTRIDQGAEVVDIEMPKGQPPAMIKTSDGTTLYMTRDIAAAHDRFERFNFDRSLYVVAQDQALHFSQLFKVLGAMGYDWADRCAHVPFGRVHGMATRKGKLVFLDEVLNRSVEQARKISEESGKIAEEHLEATIEAIGVGSIMFGDLKNLRTSDYDFDWEEVLNFSGHTAPYVQFSHARACSIIEKGGGVPAQADLTLLTMPEERKVITALARYPETVEEACEAYEPSIVNRALIDLAQTTASYLSAGNRDREQRVLVEGNDELKAARLWLVDAVRKTLAHGLKVLGCRAPTAM